MMQGQLTGNFTAIDEAEAHAIFERMHRIYGSKWSSSYGRSIYGADGQLTEDARGWLVTVRKMNREQCAAAITQAQKVYAEAIKATGASPWPPSPLEFYALGTIAGGSAPATQANHQAYQAWKGYADKSTGRKNSEPTRAALTHDKAKRNTQAGFQALAELKRMTGARTEPQGQL